MQQDRNEITRRRAYAIWEAEGRPEGRDKDNWAQAESEGGFDLAEAQESYSAGEEPGPGAPDAESGLPEAQAQAGEFVPERAEDQQPFAATPDAEAEASLDQGGGPARRGEHTGP